MTKQIRKIRKISYSKSGKTDIQRSMPLSSLIKEIKKYKPLSKEEINDLMLTSQNGDKKEKEKAVEKLCKHNILLVITIAKSYCTINDNIDDLIQEGNIGLMKAIEMFDITKGVPFSNYSAYWIRRYINMFKLNMTPIVHKKNKLNTETTIKRITTQLFQKLERNPTTNEILTTYNEQYPNKKINNPHEISNVEYIFIDKFENNTQSDNIKLNEAYSYNEASSSHNDYIDTIDQEDNKKLVKTFIACLNDKEKKVISLMFGLEDGIETGISVISQELGYTKSRVMQIYHEAIKKMQSYKEKHYITKK